MAITVTKKPRHPPPINDKVLSGKLESNTNNNVLNNDHVGKAHHTRTQPTIPTNHGNKVNGIQGNPVALEYKE